MGTTHAVSRHAYDGEAWMLPFETRASAGIVLARRLLGFRDRDTLVLAIPRGGVPVAAPIAQALHAELDVVVARKLGAPGYPELAIGAITADGSTYLDDDLVERLHVSRAYLSDVERTERTEADRRERLFRGERAQPRISGRTVIVVDDGLATGATMCAAVDAIRRQRPAHLVVAVPVGTREAADALRDDADEVVCLAYPEPFRGVGMHYWSFPQLEDAEVTRVLEAARTGARNA